MSQKIVVSVTAAQKEIMQRSAELSGLALASWVRSTLVKATHETARVISDRAEVESRAAGRARRAAAKEIEAADAAAQREAKRIADAKYKADRAAEDYNRPGMQAGRDRAAAAESGPVEGYDPADNQEMKFNAAGDPVDDRGVEIPYDPRAKLNGRKRK